MYIRYMRRRLTAVRGRLPGARIVHVTERVENILGHGQGGSVLVHVGTNNADREGTTRISAEIQTLGRETEEDKS